MIIHLTFQRKRHLLPAILNPSAIELKYGASNAFTDYSLSYGYIPGPATQQSVKGVKINCIGDQKMSNKPNFDAVEIPSTDPIFSTHDTSDITKRIRFPIFVFQTQCGQITRIARSLNTRYLSTIRMLHGEYAPELRRANGKGCCSTYDLPAYLCHLLV